MSEEKPRLIILGCGKMGFALIRNLHKHYTITAYEPRESAIAALPKSIREQVKFESEISRAFETHAPVILAVKPDQIAKVLKEISDNRLVISIAAGVRIRTIENGRLKSGPVLRAMPNAPFQISAGITAIIGNETCSEEDYATAQTIFQSGGEVIRLKDENLMHAVTGLSGSGPAYVYLFLQHLEESGVLMGLTREDARKLAQSTVLGSVKVAMKKNEAPQNCIPDITSPGGTTIRGLEVLYALGFPAAVQKAVRAATERSVEIGKLTSDERK